MKPHTWPAALGVALLPLACSGNLSGPTLKIQAVAAQPSYEAGAIVQLGLTNVSTDTVVYGLCGQQLEKLANGKDWESLDLSPPACRAIGVILLPGAKATLDYQLPISLAAGTYRLTNTVPAYQSTTFTVTVTMSVKTGRALP